MDLSAGHRKVQWAAFAIDRGMDFGGSAATTDADGLIFLPPFSPAGRAMCLHDRAVDQIQTVARFCCQRVENLLPDAAARPPIEAIVRRAMKSEIRGKESQ